MHNEQTKNAGNETATMPCQRCGVEIKVVVIAGRRIGGYCNACVLIERQSKTMPKLNPKDKAVIRAAIFEKLVPAYYRGDQLRAAMPKEKADELTEHVKRAWTTGDPEAPGAKIITQAGGVMAYGATGKFKTTCMFNGPIRWLIWKGQRVKWVRCSDWRQKLSEAARQGVLQAYLAPFIRERWLFLDDIGQMSGTPTAEEALKELLEARFTEPGGPLPLLCTTQYDEDQFKAQFKDKLLGDACARRIFDVTGPPILFS